MDADSTNSPSGSAVRAPFQKREQVIELAVFLFLIGPSLVLSFALRSQGNITFTLTAVAAILRDLSLLSLILFFLWRNHESILTIGWTLRGVRTDILLGVVLFVPLFFAAAGLDRILGAIGLSSPSAPLPSLEPGRSAMELLLALILVIVVACTEETIFRGYLMLRFKAFLASPFSRALLSAFIFSLGHGYEGTAGVVTVGAMGLVLGLVYAWRNSLAAPITIHFLQDFASIVLLPWLAGR